MSGLVSRYVVAVLLLSVMVLSISGLIQLVPASTFSEWTVPTSNSAPFGVFVSGGLIYFTEFDASKIGELNPSRVQSMMFYDLTNG